MINYKAFSQFVSLPTKLAVNPALLSRPFRVQTAAFKCWKGHDHLSRGFPKGFDALNFDFKDVRDHSLKLSDFF